MRSLDTWFSEYAVSHQNETNIAIHYICVPAIFFSIVGLLMSIPAGILAQWVPGELPLLTNWASLALIFVLLFYFRLSLSMGGKIFLFASLCILGNFYIDKVATLWLVSLFIFTVAWIGQFYGHKIEGKKPSFLEDLQFLPIEPAWVIKRSYANGN